MSKQLDALVQRLRFTVKLDAGERVFRALPVSGGADSTALALLMHLAFPDVDFHLVFSDTGAEGDEVYAVLDRLEVHLGKPVERITSGHTLFSLIDDYSGFLPSASARWCTRQLKLVPFQAWLSGFRHAGQRIEMFVGIRADEDRVAFVADGVRTRMPFVEAGIGREDVFRALAESELGIPSFYKHRSRSGCSVCPFQRSTEVVGLLQTNKVEFQRMQQYEKVSTPIRQHNMPVPAWEDAKIARNWVGFPQPASWEASREGWAPTVARIEQADLFDRATQGIWCAAEFFVSRFYLEPVVWRQELVAVSTTLPGLKRQLVMHYQHRLATSEVWHLEPQQMREELRYVLYYVLVDAELVDVSRPGEGSYTWQQGHSLQRTRRIWCVGPSVLCGLRICAARVSRLM
ncbi:phosphoadenosine phosphosulfate reductase family protein [Craterilacuibacter sp.]|uniref:phosphoadenosine phosphosulfate reductase family protein n=1 Tax=Craterilacuibacter sp. TaxID=2870909 RepID=UPI003F2EB737